MQQHTSRLFAEDLPGIFRKPVPSLDEVSSRIASRLEPENSTMLIALANERIAGVIELAGESLAEERHVGTFCLSVGSDFRGQGVGTALITALLEWAPHHGISRIQGWAWATNPGAIALYERMGFVREGVCRRAVMRDGEPIDVVLLARVAND